MIVNPHSGCPLPNHRWAHHCNYRDSNLRPTPRRCRAPDTSPKGWAGRISPAAFEEGDQPTLEAEVEEYFDTAPKNELVTKTTVEKGHGRIETRIYTASSNVDWIGAEKSYPGQPRFENINTLVKASTGPNTPIAAPSIRGFTSHRRRSISNVSRMGYAVIGASKACIGCSMSRSRTICRATAAVTEPKIWPWCAASPSVLSEPTSPREASKPKENQPDGILRFLLKILQIK